MALEPSILKSVKKNLGLTDAYDDFDQDVLTHVNTGFFILNQIGVGPLEGFMIEDDAVLWAEFDDDRATLMGVRSWMYLKVRLLFDPPGTSYHITALEEQLKELTYRLLMERQSRGWSNPADLESIYDIILDGGDSTSGG